MAHINEEMLIDFLAAMPEEKKQKVERLCKLNHHYTSTYGPSSVDMLIYKEGWYVTLNATRCSYSFFVKDNDGEFKFTRKPKKLHLLYIDYFKTPESFWLAC